VSAKSHLARLEAALPVVAAVVAWLERAHAFGSFDAYMAEQAALPRRATDIARLFDQVRGDAEQRFAKRSLMARREAVWPALQAAHLRVLLVAALGSEAVARQQRLFIEYALLVYGSLILVHDGDSSLEPRARVTAGRPEVLAAIRAHVVDGARQLLVELYRAAAVRSIIERRYLGGHPALFPETAAEHDRLLACAISMIEAAEFLAADGPPENPRIADGPATPDLRIEVLQDLAERWAPAVAAQLVDQARVDVLRSTGDDREADRLEARLHRTTYRVRPPSGDSEPKSTSA